MKTLSAGQARTMDCRSAYAGPNSSGNRFSNAPEALLADSAPVQALPAGIVGVVPDKIFRRRFRPGAGYALTGQFVVILQWARIVTESQSGTASREKPRTARRYPENITRARPKSDGRARFNTAGFSRAFHTRDISAGFRLRLLAFSRGMPRLASCSTRI
ncbi:hypothetical protein [Paraburkholderia sp. BL21I4N1]|uniref:hypothetical protein n=1 Tax=Paraburkholderia sp. BL21I4N1 TaxID=1938801 RepID=UPI0011B24DD0|nr:hypothetical protein [Paraburkholderia sp. BL21I4N1]